MSVIALVGNKGGAGKTTLSVNLAAGLGQSSRVIVVDADPQGSALQWNTFAEHQDTNSVVKVSDAIDKQISLLKQQYDHIVVDCPPSARAVQTHEVLKVCDIALIPVQPSPIDLWASTHIEEAIQQARQSNAHLNALLVINQLEPRTILSKLVRDALSEINLPVANTALRRRAIYRSSALEGKNIFQMGSRGSDAVEEMNELILEIKKHE